MTARRILPWLLITCGLVLGFNLGLIGDDTGGETDGHLFWRGWNAWAHAEENGDLVLDSQSLASPNSTATPTATGTPTPTPTTTHAPLLDLTQVTPVACSESRIGDTRAGTAYVSSYGCVPYWPEQGPEQVYALGLTAVTDLDVMLADPSVDLDLFLLTSASPATCIGYGDNSVSASALAPGTYYLVVDGYDGVAGTYRLQVWCPLELTPGPSPTPTVTPTATPNTLHMYLPLLQRGL